MLQRGVRRDPILTTFQPAALGAAPLAGKWKGEQSLEGVLALKHGANENTEKGFCIDVFCLLSQNKHAGKRTRRSRTQITTPRKAGLGTRKPEVESGHKL